MRENILESKRDTVEIIFDKNKKIIDTEIIKYSKSKKENLEETVKLNSDNMQLIAQAIADAKEYVEYKPDVTKENLFLFDAGVDKEIVYNTQLVVLEHAENCIDKIDKLEKVADMMKQSHKSSMELHNSFCLYVKTSNVKNIKDINQVVDLLTRVLLSAVCEKVGCSEDIGKPYLVDELKKRICNLRKTDKTYDNIFSGFSYNDLQKSRETLSKLNIESHIVHTGIEGIFDENDLKKEIIKAIKKDNKDKKEIISKTVEKKLKCYKLLAILDVILTIMLMIVWSGWQENFPAVEILTVGGVMLISLLVIRSCIGRSESKKRTQEDIICVQKEEEYDDKYFKLLFKCSDSFYQENKTEYFDKRKELIKIQEAANEKLFTTIDALKQMLLIQTREYLPDGLVDNPRMLKTIIKVMKEGRANEFKMARSIAEEVIGREENLKLQTEYLANKAIEDQKQREAILDSQYRMESAARSQAQAARRAAEAQERAAQIAAETQKNAEAYAKNQAENMQKLIEIEREREIREKEEYWRNKTNT